MNLRNGPSTLTARQPRPFAGTWKCGKSWSSQAWWSRSPTGTYLGDDDRGCSNADHEEGSTDPSGITLQNGVIPRSPCPSLDGVRPMLLETAMSRAPSLHRGGRQVRARPRRVSGDAPARGTREGSTEGMAPRRHLEAFNGRRPPRGGTRGGAPSARRRKTARRASRGNSRRRGAQARRGNADRSDSSARRRIHGSRACPRVEMRCRDRSSGRSPEKPWIASAQRGANDPR